MRKLLAAITLSAAFGLASAQADLLTNGSFESGDTSGWAIGGGPPDYGVGAPGVGAQDGSFAVELFIPGNSGVAEVNQFMPANPGDEFNLSGYLLTEAPLPAGDTFGLFKIVFRDAGNNDLLPASASIGMINAAFPGVESTPFLKSDQASAVDTWVFSEAQGVAPAGTTQVGFLALNVDFATFGTPNPIWVDNVTATLIPEPSTMALLGMGAFVIALRRRMR